MHAAITWYAGENSTVHTLNSSGLGFYAAAGFGSSIGVGNWNERTFITNSGGTAMGPEVDNCKYASLTGVVLGQTGTPITLNKIPNQQATFNARFTNDTAVRVQNATMKFTTRADTGVPASGVTVAFYEVVHPDTVQNANGSGGPSLVTVSGAHAWTMCYATGLTTMTLTPSPGTSGLSPSGSGTTDTQHDWYASVSVSPDSAGSKLFQAWLALEYL